MNLVFQGTIDPLGGTQINCDYESMIISLIVINNITANYNLTISRLDTAAAATKTLLYSFLLDSGDSVRDVTQYKMAKGDYIHLESSGVANTTYYISAEVS